MQWQMPEVTVGTAEPPLEFFTIKNYMCRFDYEIFWLAIDAESIALMLVL